MHRYIAVVVLLWAVNAQAVEVRQACQVNADRNSVSPIYYNSAVNPDYVASPLDTGLYLSLGDWLEMTADGTWGNASWLTFGPEGNPHENIAAGYPGAGMPVAALIARIGNNPYFYIGRYFAGRVTETGYLELGFNDTDYGNNWGTLTVAITVTTTATNRPPVANAGPDQIIEATGVLTDVMLDGSGSNDVDSDPLTYIWTWEDGSATGINPTVSLPLGTTTVTLVVNDGMINSVPDTVDITVEDTTPPLIGDPLSADLWPPNHRMVTIDIPVIDLVDAVPTVIITNPKELDISGTKGAGGQNQEPDMVINKDVNSNDVISLRAERSGLGGGRIYIFNVTAMDESGNVTTKMLSVSVGHDRWK